MGEQVAWRASTRRVNECTEAVLEYVERQPRGQGASLGTMPLCDHSKEAVFPVDSPESKASVASQHNVVVRKNAADCALLGVLQRFEARQLRPLAHRLPFMETFLSEERTGKLELLHVQLSLYAAGEMRGYHVDSPELGDVVVSCTLQGSGILQWVPYKLHTPHSIHMDAGHVYSLGLGLPRECLHQVVPDPACKSCVGNGSWERIALTCRYKLS